jgi:hypothetical protein
MKTEQGMSRRRRVSWLLIGACCLLLVVAVVAVVPMTLAQTGYDLSWWTVDGGGHTLSTGEGYRLSGTAGQPDAGVLEGVGYTLAGGFWRGGEVSGQSYEVYLPLVLRGY